MFGEAGLLLVQVDRHQLEVDRRLLLQLQQDVQHRIAVLAAGQAHHDPVAFLDHPVIGDGLADLPAQPLGELALFAGVATGIRCARRGIGEDLGQGLDDVHANGHCTGRIAMTTKPRPVYARRVDTQNPADIAQRIAELRREHRELDEAIAQWVASDPETDEVAIKRMKKRKLWLKDCIARLESALIPDEPA